MTGEIPQKYEMILPERIEELATNYDKSKQDQKIPLIIVNKCITSQQSEMIEEINQTILLILGV